MEQERPAGEGAANGRAPDFVHRVDLVVAGVVLAITGFLYWATFDFDKVPSSLAQNVQPTAFPRMILVVVAVMAAVLPFEHIVKRRQGIDLDGARSTAPRPIVFLTVLAMLLVTGLMVWTGTFIGLVLASAGLPLLWGERRWKYLIPYVIVFPTLVMWFFASVLEVSFLPGFVGHIFR